MITNPSSGTNVHEVAPGIYRINTPVAFPGGAGAFNFNQYLIADDEPLLFHTGPRRMFHLLLTDANMPGMSGIELVRTLLAERPGLPVIVMSGFTEGCHGSANSKTGFCSCQSLSRPRNWSIG